MKTIIIGAGISGTAAFRLARAAGQNAVLISDGDTAAAEIIFEKEDTAVVSPGVSVGKSPLLRQAIASGCRIIGEMAFAFEYYPGPLLAVTGTNGKTTTTEIAGAVLRGCGYGEAVECGNIGLPLSAVAADIIEKKIPAESIPPVALEVSSFQLEYPGDFAPFAAVVLNCASDHLDRHGNSLEEYKKVKYRIFDWVIPENRIAMNDPAVTSPHRFSCENGTITFNGKKIIELAELTLPGSHNLENLLAALELTSRFVPAEKYFTEEFRQALRDFRTGKHRIELFAEAGGVKYYDDSKATNPAAVVAAVKAVNTPVRLLAGGLDKDMDFSELVPVLDKIKKFYLIGEAADKISRISAAVPFEKFANMGSAVAAMYREALPGESVLLSPACASMDMFKNYAERGERFKEECRKHLQSCNEKIG